jgi:hypothetical protein
MNTLLKFAVGAAIGGALVHLLRNQRSAEDEWQEGEGDTSGPPLETASDDRPASSVDDLVTDTNMVSSGDAERDQRGAQPQDWRGAQNVLDS